MLDELGIGMSQSVPEAPSAAAEQEQKAGATLPSHGLTQSISSSSDESNVSPLNHPTESDPVLSELEMRLKNLRQT